MPSLKFLALFLGIVAVPVISLVRAAAANSWTAPVPLLEVSLIVAIFGGAFFGLAAFVSTRWSEHRTTAISVVGWFAFTFLNVGGLRLAFETAGWTAPWQWLIIVLVISGLAVWIAIRFDSAARYLVTFVPILVAFQAILLTVDLARLDEPTPVPAASSDANVGAPPSIWIIVLDSHASPKVLRELLDIDLSESVERLETVGFRVWDDARSNYSLTLASIPSLLSGEVWDAEAIEESYAALLAGVQADTPLVASLQQSGLTIRMIPANWSRSRCGAFVDDCIANPRYDENWFFLLRSTPLPDLLPAVFPHPWPSGGLQALDVIAAAERTDRHFTFVHSLASHPPTIINSDCRYVSDREGKLRNQLVCMHNVLFEALSTIDLTTDVVIVTADHGYAFGDISAPPEQWTDKEARGRFSAFTAISTPDDCEEGFPDRLSGAQLLPLVLNCYGADLPVPTHRFMSVSQRHLGGIGATELAWDGWSPYEP